MSSLVIVLRQPNVKINLKLLKGLIDLLAERYLIKLVENRAMESLADPIRLRMPDFCLCVFYIAHREKELEVMRVRPSAIFGSSIGENAKHGHVELVEEGNDPVVEKIGRVMGVLVV